MVYVLHQNGDSDSGEAWLHTGIDNEAVSAVRHEDMFGNHENRQVGSDGWCAYMLFYCCTIPPQTHKDLSLHAFSKALFHLYGTVLSCDIHCGRSRFYEYENWSP